MANENRDNVNRVPPGLPEEDVTAVSGVPSVTPDPEEPAATTAGQEVEPQPGRAAQVIAALRGATAERSRESKAGERTRGLVLLVGGMLVCVLLFFALFTTESGSSRKERKRQPTLGRPERVQFAEDANRSPVPQLSANPAPPEEPDELTEKEVLETMRHRGAQPPPNEPPVPPPPTERRTLSSVNFDDPALVEAYRRQTPPPPRTEVKDWSAAVRESRVQPRPVAEPPAADQNEELRKSSIVYVRTEAAAAVSRPSAQPAIDRSPPALLPPGTALVARLQHAVSSAAKTPVVAVIEYNYEHDGQLVVPVGTRAYGEISQATPQGWVSIRFHSLEFPNGEQQAINGSAISMEREVLRGHVNGKNTGLKALTRTLTGIGTIAAYAVGGRGAGGGIDSSILLRERLASNIALTGEQQLATLAYQQNIVVTVPAKTQFYLVLHETAAGRQAEATATASATASRDGMSDQEVREVTQLRNEIREMNRLMRQSMSGAGTELSSK